MRKCGVDTYTDYLKASTDLCIASKMRRNVDGIELKVQNDDGNDSDSDCTAMAEVVGRRIITPQL